jgi:HepT-like protein
VISKGMVERLDAYLDFRHFFRHAYLFTLRWERMKALALDSEETLRQLEAELDSFLRGAA